MKNLKGNAIIGQSGGPSAVINATLAGVIEESGRQSNIAKLYGTLHGIEGFLDENIIEISKYIHTPEHIRLLRQTPASFLKTCRHKLPSVEAEPETYEKIFEVFKRYDIKYFFYIGGNDSMDTVDKLCRYASDIRYEINIVGLPKTIDNDLCGTDHTPGFGSAAKFVATSVKNVCRDVYSYNIPYVLVLEIMGRNAGWLTASAALAKGPDCEGADLIYLPETPFDTEAFLTDTEALLKEKQAVVVAVSEGLKDAKGEYIFEKEVKETFDKFGHKMLGGSGAMLSAEADKRFRCKTRAIEFSLLQRCAGHCLSRTDAEEAFLVGRKGCEWAASEGASHIMVTINRTGNEPYASEIGSADISTVSNREKFIPREWITARGNHVTDDMLTYLRPLVSGEPEIVTANGLPAHIKI